MWLFCLGVDGAIADCWWVVFGWGLVGGVAFILFRSGISWVFCFLVAWYNIVVGRPAGSSSLGWVLAIDMVVVAVVGLLCGLRLVLLNWLLVCRWV